MAELEEPFLAVIIVPMKHPFRPRSQAARHPAPEREEAEAERVSPTGTLEIIKAAPLVW